MDQMDHSIRVGDNSYSHTKVEKKRSPLGQMWSFTLNNFRPSELDHLDQLLTLSTWPAAVGQEVGEQGILGKVFDRLK